MHLDKPILENENVKLSPLSLDNYHELFEIAVERDLIQYSPSDISTKESYTNYVKTAIAGLEKGVTLPFIIYDKRTNIYIGSTRFGLINHHDKVLHIGWTWISKSAQGTGINKQMKFLMLQYVFETLAFEKVEFRIDERNIRSRKAVEKIGGTLEGILRKNTLMQDGYRRNTCCYGILKEEWREIKKSKF
ncbi:MAG: GNAT family N-acetyltransferase [Flavobacteriaceae bacterium]|nr:GNAT family N-acetyltransferase [Flavobacteriaceae bacterium]